MEIDICPDDSDLSIQRPLYRQGKGRAAELLGACSIVCREFGLGKQIQNPIISMYNRNSEMGQDKTCGLVGKVKKPEFRVDVICQRDSGPDIPPESW